MKCFLIALLFSTAVFAKNKILYIEKPTDPKSPPNFYVINDFKKPFSKKLIDSSIDSYASTDDYVVYLKAGNLYIITDFDTYNKVLVTDFVTEYKLRKGMLFYTRSTNLGVIAYVVTDFKNLTKHEIVSNFISYNIDEP